jgi:hypothetical protein
MATMSMKVQAGLVAGALGAALVLSAARSEAQINVGPDLGVAYRSSEPKLNAGFAAGAHLEAKLVPMVSLGGYFLWYGLKTDFPGINSSTAFTTVGGRVRFHLPLPDSNFRPYAFIGLGRVAVSYPGEYALNTVPYATPRSASFAKREGWFLEVPIGLGAAYKVASIAQVFLDFAFRPGFNFKGDAYTGTNPVDEPKMGLTVLAGGALDF